MISKGKCFLFVVLIGSISFAPVAGVYAQNGAAAVTSDSMTYPAPKNLKVLPSELTGAQVHEIMEQWETDLGTHCSTCHAADPNNIAPNGRPRLNYPDDSKQEKNIARMMYSMTEGINKDFIAKIDNSGVPVSCGTCHRGHIGPLPYAGTQ